MRQNCLDSTSPASWRKWRSFSSSWPDLFRPSTSCFRTTKTWKPGRDGWEGQMSKLLAVLCAAIVVSLSSLASAAPLKVAISQRGFYDSSFVDFAEAAGFFQDLGLHT